MEVEVASELTVCGWLGQLRLWGFTYRIVIPSNEASQPTALRVLDGGHVLPVFPALGRQHYRSIGVFRSDVGMSHTRPCPEAVGVWRLALELALTLDDMEAWLAAVASSCRQQNTGRSTISIHPSDTPALQPSNDSKQRRDSSCF